MVESILTFLGRMHPFFVHLPIGFLVLAVALDGVSHVKRYRHLGSAVPFTLLLGFSAASCACLAALKGNDAIKRVYTWKTLCNNHD